MIHVIATIEATAGERETLLEEFARLVPTVRAEDGCIEYGTAIDAATGIEAQGGVRENVVTVVERWESLDALKAHLQAQHMVDFRERVKDIVSGIRLQVLEPA